jgi:ribosome-binding ATPase YchF (GTP1/OBG family)
MIVPNSGEFGYIKVWRGSSKNDCPELWRVRLQNRHFASMKVGLVGFAGSGKSTVFHWLTGVKPDPASGQRGQLGAARIPDARLDWLSAQFRPKKTTPATIEFFDTPGLLPPPERRDNPRRLSILREAGGLLVVLNGFRDNDPGEELQRFREELFFADLEILTNRIKKLQEQFKKPKPGKEREADQQEHELLERIVAAMEQSQTAAGLGLRPDEERAIRSFQLLTLKPELVLLNTSDERTGTSLPPRLAALAANALAAPAKLELELEELPSTDREAFMQDLGLAGFSRTDVLKTIFQEMGKIVFFTIGDDECRAWVLSKGENAVEGAGQIHTDLAKGFVRAEVVHWDDFRRVGSLKEAKAHGVYHLEGKTYVVQDGDIMHILASA